MVTTWIPVLKQRRISQDIDIKLVCIEHEFGLFGGEMGEYLLGFFSVARKTLYYPVPYSSTSPDAKRLKIVESIGLLADKLIVMTKNSARLLKEITK